MGWRQWLCRTAIENVGRICGTVSDSALVRQTVAIPAPLHEETATDSRAASRHRAFPFGRGDAATSSEDRRRQACLNPDMGRLGFVLFATGEERTADDVEPTTGNPGRNLHGKETCLVKDKCEERLPCLVASPWKGELYEKPLLTSPQGEEFRDSERVLRGERDESRS